MYTRWHMAIFLFMGCVGTALLLYSALCLVKGGGNRRPLPAIVGAVFSAVAVASVAMSLNEPSKIIHLLAKPASGLSSALIGQFAVIVAALFIYFKSVANKNLSIGIGGVVSLASAICLSRIYMVNSRPAIDTFLMYILIVLIIVQLVGYLATSKETESRDKCIMLGLAGVYGISMLAFLFRLAYLVPEDRLFTFTSMSFGALAPMFWAIFIFSALLPALITTISLIRKGTDLSKVQQISYVVGVFIFCVMINQAPVIVKSIINRPV